MEQTHENITLGRSGSDDTRAKTDKPELLRKFGLKEDDVSDEAARLIAELYAKTVSLQLRLSEAAKELRELKEIAGATSEGEAEMLAKISWSQDMLERYDNPSSLLVIEILDYKALLGGNGINFSLKAEEYIEQTFANFIRKTDAIVKLSEFRYGVLFYNSAADRTVARLDSIKEKLMYVPVIVNSQKINMRLSTNVVAIETDKTPAQILVAANEGNASMDDFKADFQA